MHILLTRPLEDCSEMILKLKNLGHQISHLPLLKIEAVQYEKINLTDFNAIIFTSANAIKYLNSKDFDKDIPCFCVGNATENYNLKRIVNYKTIHNETFDEKFVEKLKLQIPDIVYVYSQNSAASFLNFIKNYQSESLWMNTNLMCIGEKTSSILNEIKWKKIFLFNPGEEEFLLYKI